MAEDGPAHLQTDVWDEELAAAYLREKGYVILERDWHSGYRDIDIIAQKDCTIVFVEVKTRSSSDFLDPITAVNRQKLCLIILKSKANEGFFQNNFVILQPKVHKTTI